MVKIMKETKSFEEIENYVLNYMEHCNSAEMVELYEKITGKQVEVEDWI